MVDVGAQTSEQGQLAQDFVRFAVESGVLRFGEFKTKAGRLSPYFFNAGLFDDGRKIGRLAEFYAKALLASGIEFDMVFGPAYKGIPLAATVAVELARLGRNVPFAYNRKEAKDHGEGGTLVGAPLKGRVLIVDDVMSAGTAARESIAIIRAAGATPRWLMGNVNTDNTQAYQFGWNGTRLESSASASLANNKFTVSDSSATPNVAWADGEWHHIAAAWDGFLNVGRVYVDGAQVGANATGSSLGTGDQQAAWQLSMALGARNNGGTLDGFWAGLVDDLRIYRGLLTSAQVQAVFSATTVAPDPTAGPADFDGNGTVDGGDFLVWQRGFGVGTTPAEGDADGNQTVDGADLAAWIAAFGQTVEGQGNLAAIPEPAGAMLLAAAVCGLVGFRRR